MPRKTEALSRSPQFRRQATKSGAELVGLMIGRYGMSAEGPEALAGICRRKAANPETIDQSNTPLDMAYGRLAYGEAAIIAEGLAMGLGRGSHLRKVDEDVAEATRAAMEAARKASGL